MTRMRRAASKAGALAGGAAWGHSPWHHVGAPEFTLRVLPSPDAAPAHYSGFTAASSAQPPEPDAAVGGASRGELAGGGDRGRGDRARVAVEQSHLAAARGLEHARLPGAEPDQQARGIRRGRERDQSLGRRPRALHLAAVGRAPAHDRAVPCRAEHAAAVARREQRDDASAARADGPAWLARGAIEQLEPALVRAADDAAAIRR